MTPQIMRILKKLYRADNYEYDRERSVSIYSESILSEKERDMLEQYGWSANDIVYFANHDDILQKLLSLKDNTALSQKRCIESFIAGVGGSYPRGRSVLSAWHKLNTLSLHRYDEQGHFACCWVCQGHDEPLFENGAYFQYCLYLGHAYTSQPHYAYLNLKHLVNAPAVQPTVQDVQTFSTLLDLLRNAPEDETPGQFEKRLTSDKILSGDKYTKRGILDSLASVGVIPNPFLTLTPYSWTDFGDIASSEDRLSNTKGRSDMEMPWAGWRGSLKPNEEIMTELFGDYL
ncbi:hypothetical protein PC41400_17950 [Paenibacillus chitinolyticus]|uniref:Uncharacterized protein n=1 Tax=Paenibacillus chitinolyticus TaxID=79263 RepID=A0A410WYM6_9BACL|nr:hypothetical protein [Paenibacillus chitinolyticus]MCY9590578.1 hypothetical protein [Paenibacillus chitinolyticus]MCY9596427.1 hypothetical protein [Paenibacillus chitinolyticus]QAV19443.1 hypothetical protein PC41400_17950 [Paenibacillus chitinolyticus]